MGGKLNLRELIYQRMPADFQSYIEVFGGAAWVLLGMEVICKIEIYNDSNANLVNLFRCVRDRTLAFILELGFLPLTSRDEFKLLKRKKFDNPYLGEELDIAQKTLSEPEAAEVCGLLTELNGDTDIRYLYRDFYIEEVERLDNMAQRYAKGQMYKELLISNYDTTERIQLLPEQTTLFPGERKMASQKTKGKVLALVQKFHDKISA